MKFEVSQTDFMLLTSVLNLIKRGGYGCSITREDIIRESGVSRSAFISRMQNIHLKEKQLKERIA
ncbi:hypothetical protein SJPD1_1061 [Sulfurospirillum diekertiae]|uniref:Uncharacterized protein n=1 Tax=Sulfurospirillum diekertiae TaxID=1854492 RepID=A0A290HC99_9BACT|nr:hypothetical protein Sdiek1_1155 [Sulfurospirillum diekertiae]ASC93159.1 hypothetical protein Sdiek2_1138 [Sulfurospirillum diekertiae]ATB68870.1 hypothetical protein SJPD1_0756 [Sulfurospirillum diekertiae]ATB69173.1 hypothetical protein SJPD1_1061 [Sulfurospirillum diekertiae]